MSLQDCPNCGHSISSQDKHHDADAPEIGWSYYVCSNCGKRSHPGLIEPGQESLDETPDKRQFKGTVVETDEPILLDDGNEVMECHGLHANNLALGQQATVKGTPTNRDSNRHSVDATVMINTELRTTS